MNVEVENMGLLLSLLLILVLIACIWGRQAARRVISITTGIVTVLILVVAALIYLSNNPGFLSVVGKGIMAVIGLGFVLWWGSRRS